MSEEKQSNPPAGAPRSRPGDIGRRIALRRAQLGLTREQTAALAGMAPGYLEYVEEQPADVGIGAAIRLADALQTTVSQLRGGAFDVPPGQAGAAVRPRLEELTPGQCWARLAAHGVGRVALSTKPAPSVLPVNYTVMDGAIVYRTAPGSAPAAATGEEVAFEVDQVDEALSQGWSVLAIGPAEQVSEPEAVRHLSEQSTAEPWPGGTRNVWIRITPTHLTGRVIRAA